MKNNSCLLRLTFVSILVSVMVVLRSQSLGAQAITQVGIPADGPISSTSLLEVKDVFGRNINEFGLVLVDWEGYLANPAIEFVLCPPVTAAYPATLTLAANGERLYFDSDPQGGQVGAGGPTKVVTFSSAAPQSTFLSIFPDRDSLAEQYALTIQFTDSQGLQLSESLPIQVVDQDVGSSLLQEVHLDFSEDQSGFFLGSQESAILQQAADDWAYFLVDMNLDIVSIGSETTWIWNYPEGFNIPGNGYFVTNSTAYDGFLLYTYGLDTPLLRSGGEPSNCCFQSSAGAGLPLRRSGGVEIEVKGNFNQLGWFLSAGDDDWHVSKNLANEANDLYSIAHHEIGHALLFHSEYPNFAAAEGLGEFQDADILDYFGSPVPVDSVFDHFPGVVDPASLRGIFGNEYFGSVPARRWLITKLDLLLMQAIGYTLRDTSSLSPLGITDSNLADGTVGVVYFDSMQAAGGIPFYDWVLDSGSLPPGLELNRFTGEIRGTPTVAGLFSFTIQVRDYENGAGVFVNTSIDVQ